MAVKNMMDVASSDGSGGGVKADAGKPRIELMYPEAVFAFAEVATFGAAKYADRNVEKGMQWGRVFGATMRHLWKWWGGEDLDDESGLPHLHHALWGVATLAMYRNRKIGEDNRGQRVFDPAP